MKPLLLLAVFIIVAVALYLALRPSGPRVTTIEHRRDDGDGGGSDGDGGGD